MDRVILQIETYNAQCVASESKARIFNNIAIKICPGIVFGCQFTNTSQRASKFGPVQSRSFQRLTEVLSYLIILITEE